MQPSLRAFVRFAVVSALILCGIICVVNLLSFKVFAQTPDVGTISGTVRDAEGGEILRGATVQVLDTKKGAYTDVKGTYNIKGLAAGKYSLKFNFIGFTSKTVSDVELKAGETVQLNVVLISSVKKTEEVVVTVKRVNDNASAALAQRKNAAQVSDGITEAEIKKLPDADAGQALKRVPGVTLVGDKFVYVRGVSERYSNTTLNGAALTSTEPDKKAFAFDMFPAEFLQNANVAKSFTPDLPGNFAGGLVQLNTIDFPEKFLLKASISSSYNDNVTFQSERFQTYEGGSRDWLAFDDGTRALPATTPTNRRAMDGLLRRAGDMNDANGAADWIELGQKFNGRVWNQQRISAPVNAGIGLAFATPIKLDDDSEIGIVANLNYNNSYSINTIERDGILANGQVQFQTDGQQATQSAGWGGLLNLAYKFGGNSSITFKNIYNRSMDNEVISLDGFDVGQNRDRRFYSAQFVEKTLYSGQLGGEHTFTFLGNSLLDWRVGYSSSRRDEPDFRRLRYSRELGNQNEQFRADIPATQQGDGTVAGRFYSGLADDLVTGSFNLTLPFESGLKLKTGYLFERRDRSFGARSLTVILARAILSDVPTDVDLTQSPGQLLASQNFRGDGLGISEDSKPSDVYSADETLHAGYVMGDYPFQVGELKFRAIGGLRVESNVQRLNSFTDQGAPLQRSPSFIDFLPSAHLVWIVDNSTNIRASATRTLSRPSLREFAPFAFFDFQSQSRVAGNPNLVRSLINNFDLRYELFMAPGEVFAVSGFFKTFENAIEETIQPGSVIARTFSNAQGLALNYGAEVEIRKSFGFIAPALESLMFNGNVALIDSRLTVQQGSISETRQMWGQSPYSINVGFSYTIPDIGTNINVGYNRFGQRIVQVAQLGVYEVRGGASPHVFELPRDVVDISVMHSFGSLDVKFLVRDLLNQQLIWEQIGTRIASNLRGRTFSVGMSYRFQ
ncbi:MAG: TonB-dependent receptor [Candidatus Kapaibacterium sp.]|nr:MAG: TonB-dependent receptor [Candidatus Kapabacteria bacterium]